MLTLMYDTIIIGSVDSIDTEREIRRSEKLNINKIIKSTPALYQSKSQKQQKKIAGKSLKKTTQQQQWDNLAILKQGKKETQEFATR